MNETILTDREREYLDCDVPLLTTGQKVSGLTAGFLIGLLQAAFTPGSTKGNQKLIRTSRLIRYTKYKKAVLRKRDGARKPHDEKLLKKLNGQPFVLEEEAFDADAYTQKLYEEYMNKMNRQE